MDDTFLEKHPEFKDASSAMIDAALRRLSYREREIFKLMVGLTDGYSYSPEQIAQIFQTSTSEMLEAIPKIITRTKQQIHALRQLDEESAWWAAPIETEKLPISIFIDPGDASIDTISDVLEALSDLHRAHGGLGLEYLPDSDRVLVIEEALPQ